MEREPIEPGVLAVEIYKDEETHRRRSWSLAAVALGCSLLGAGAALAVIRLAPGWVAPDIGQRTVQSTVPVQPGPSATRLYAEPKNPEVAPEKQPEPTETVPPTKSQTGDAPVGNIPLNPFSGAIVSRTPLPEGWSAGEPLPTNSHPSGEQPRENNDAKPASGILVTLKLGSGDPEGEAADVTSKLQGSGASIRSATHYNLAGSAIGVQIIATIPEASLSAALAKLGHPGEKWSGPPGERADRISGIFASRLGELRARESELRKKYEDDATEVVVVREEIQKLNLGMAMARSAKSSGIAVVLIGIGDL